MSKSQTAPSLKTARGLGSAKEGTDHWWMQRLSAVAMMLLAPLMIFLVITLIGEPYDAVVAELGSPLWGGVATPPDTCSQHDANVTSSPYQQLASPPAP